MRLSGTAIALAAFVGLATTANAHDTWVEVNTSEVREGNLVYVDLKLGNHGNDHRDFRMHSLITLDKVMLAVKMPCGCTKDIKPTLIPTASEAKQGYWTTRYTTTKPGLHVVSHELDTLQKKKFERRTDEKGIAEFTPTESNLVLVVIHHQEPKRSGEGYDSTYYSATLTVAVPEVPFPVFSVAATPEK